MNAESAIARMKKGEKVTLSHADTGIFYQMCNGYMVMTLNTNGCYNNITAYVDCVETAEQFLNKMNIGFDFKSYE